MNPYSKYGQDVVPERSRGVEPYRDTAIPPSLDISNYSLDQFQKDLENFKPRAFDTYVLPAFMMYFAWKARGMPRLARRMLFVAGIYMGYRNFAEYKKLLETLRATSLSTGNASTVEAKV
jgi:hypothetical protein